MVEFEIIVGYFITGIIWGSTNALMERGSKTEDSSNKDNELKEGVKMFAKLTFLIPFLVN